MSFRNHISESSSKNTTFHNFPREKFYMFLDKKEKRCCSLWACPQKKVHHFFESVIFPDVFLKNSSQVFPFSPKKVAFFSKSVIFPDFFPRIRSPVFLSSPKKAHHFFEKLYFLAWILPLKKRHKCFLLPHKSSPLFGVALFSFLTSSL